MLCHLLPVNWRHISRDLVALDIISYIQAYESVKATHTKVLSVIHELKSYFSQKHMHPRDTYFFGAWSKSG
jgi:hypothetical protein